MLLAWAWDEDPVQVWDLQDMPFWREALQDMVDEADLVVFHNSHFDRTVLRHNGVTISADKIEDTMVTALQHGLPGALGQLCDVLNVPVDKAKDKDGKKLIQLFCKPLPRNRKLRRATRETHPDEWRRFIEYARLDVDAMRELHRRIPRWNCTPSERKLWLLDQASNDRGVAVDAGLAEAARRAFQRAAGTLAARAGDLTGGAVYTLTQRQRLIDHLADEFGYTLPDMTKGTISQALASDDLDPVARELLEIRQQAASTSPAKYGSLLGAVSSDGRLRGTIQWCGAARTGRDCIAEGTPVLVRTPEGEVREVPIEDVGIEHAVWDGDAWVRHEGVVFSGDKEVISHDGVLATPEHIVYVSTTESVTLGDAKARGLKLWRGNSPSTN